MEYHRVTELVRKDFCPSLQIDADREQVIAFILEQNFVPIVDSRGALCGILTRRGGSSSTWRRSWRSDPK